MHARQGKRHLYKPIQSLLSKTSQPLDVVQGFMKLYPFSQLYIADLNAIQKRGNHDDVITDIRAAYPHLDIWLDSGISDAHALKTPDYMDLCHVVGSETLPDLKAYQQLQQRLEDDFVLSLDFFEDEFRGPADFLAQSPLWPRRIIAMTLNRVGSNAGPDIEKLKRLVQIKRLQPVPTGIYAAGGVRNLSDLHGLEQIGVDGALVASALHMGAISNADIATLAER